MPSPRPKVPPYLLMLVVSFALLGLIGYQTLKDRKVSGDLLKQKDSLLQEKVFTAEKLELLLQKEKKKSLDLQEKLDKLSSQKDKLNGLKDGLSGQLIELDHAKRLAEEGKRKLESSLLDKEHEIKDLREKIALADETEEKLKALKKDISQKDAEIKELKAQMKALGGQVIDKPGAESANASESGGGGGGGSGSGSGGEEEGGQDKAVGKEKANAGKGIGEKVPEAEEERERDLKREGETAGKHTEGQVETLKKEVDAQSLEVEDEEARVDDREDVMANEDIGEEADAEKTREEEEADEQPDVELDAVNKTDLDENEIAAME